MFSAGVATCAQTPTCEDRRMSGGRRAAISVLVILGSLIAMGWSMARDLRRRFFADTGEQSTIPFVVSTAGFVLGVLLLVLSRGRHDGAS